MVCIEFVMILDLKQNADVAVFLMNIVPECRLQGPLPWMTTLFVI
jgi:hypothetical protein